MYLYKVADGKTVPADIKNISLDKSSYFGFIGREESEEAIKAFGIGGRAITELLDGRAVVYESREGFDLMCVNVMSRKPPLTQVNRVCVYLAKGLKLFFCKDADAAFEMICPKGNIAEIEYGRLISAFFEKLTAEDPAALESMENETASLENALITSRKRNFVGEIISLRKKLMIYKRNYEQLLDILDELQENENKILDNNSIRHFRIYSKKVDRLYQSVLHLRENVTQAREAYQAEVDISLNNIMKLFTAITAIFLPLTLIVGWYGMNLQMPEFHWPYSYPVVIVLCVAVVVFCLVYFKKHKWF